PLLRERVLFPGFVPDRDLACLYSSALAVVMPSLSEGFGLPAIEAITCGVPVLASAVGAVPEVVGDAGLLFDPHSAAELASAISRAVRRAGHEVEVVHCEDAFRLGGRVPASLPPEDDGIVVHRLHSAWGALSPLITQQTGRPGLKRRELEAILARDFDVIHFHNISLVRGPREPPVG